MFQGCGTALVTPFKADQSLDEEALRRLVRRQIEGGIHFLVPCGTTGENPTLTRQEHLRVVEITLEEAQRKGPRPRRRGRQRHARGGLAGQGPRSARRRRPAGRHPVLQQADARRPVRALRRDRPRHPPADRGLQRAGPHRAERRAGDPGTPGADRDRDRRQRGLRQHLADGRDLPGRPQGLRGALRRRRHHPAAHRPRRRRRHLGRRERGAVRHGPADLALPGGRLPGRRRGPPPAARADGGQLHRVQPRPGQGRDGDDGAPRAGLPPARGRRRAREPAQGREGPPRPRPHPAAGDRRGGHPLAG